MTVREQILAMQLSCNIQEALLLILDDCGCDKTLLASDLATIKWGIQRSVTPNQNGKQDAQIVGNFSNSFINSIYLDLKIKTDANEWLNYSPKVYLERYKPFRERGIAVNGGYQYNKVKAGFTREDFNNGNPYKRVNSFAGIEEQTIDIKPQTYFLHEPQYNRVYPIGVPSDFGNGYNMAKQIFRFVLELDVNGTIIKVNSPSFQILATSQNGGYYYGVGYAYGGQKTK